MKSVLLITSIDGLKNRLDQLIKRRYEVFDYLKIIHFDYLYSLSDEEKLKYLKFVISKREIFLVIWIPAECDSENIQYQELLSVCNESEYVRTVIFDIQNFISIEGYDIKIFENATSKLHTAIKEKCDVKVDIEYLIDAGISTLSKHLTQIVCESHCRDRQISLSLIDDIAEYVFKCEDKVEIASQAYTLSEIGRSLKSDFLHADFGSSEEPNNVVDRIETLIRQNACCLQPIYQSKAHDFWRKKRIASVRSEMGAKLAKHLSADEINEIDIVVPVPETGKYYAQGLARHIGKPFIEAIVRNQNMGRGLQIENSAQRNIFIREKLTVIEELVKDKNVGIVDEAIFTGATLRIVVDQLKDAGANRIHLLLPTPHNVRACEYNVLPQRNVLLDYVRRIDLKDYFDVDQITFANISDLRSSLGNLICFDCFDC